jgi:hypothetical protein
MTVVKWRNPNESGMGDLATMNTTLNIHLGAAALGFCFFGTTKNWLPLNLELFSSSS